MDALVAESALILAHWPSLLAIVLVLLLAGGAGRGFGVPNLFRDDDQIFDPDACWRPSPDPETVPPPAGLSRTAASPALWGGFGFVAAFGLFWIASHTTTAPACPNGSCSTELFRGSLSAALWLAAALLVATLVFLVRTWRELSRPRADFAVPSFRRRRAELARTALGAALGAAFAFVAVGLGSVGAVRGPDSALVGAAIPYLGMLGYVALLRAALPVVSISCLVVFLILVGMPLSRIGDAWTPLVALLAFGAIVIVNGRYARRRLPGFEHLYDKPVNPQGASAPEPAPVAADGLRAPGEKLGAWAGSWGAGDDPRPVLALLAVSGGAYRAGFWSSLMIDRLVAQSGPDGALPGLDRSIRLVTGASGGMVAGAYFVAMADKGRLGDGVTRQICVDTLARMRSEDGCNRRWPIARDSLSPVVHQLVRRDLPRLLIPGLPESDRGRTLDAQWTTLARPFSDLGPQAPAIVLSPMLAETGALALFSNIDLGRLRGGAGDKSTVEVFKAFPGARDTVTLATAVRLNATFPYVSPAISLPTLPDRRPVDAGYYDNFGVDLMTAYLEQEEVLDFAAERCRGVAVIQVRAFPSGLMTEKPSWRQRAFQFLTTPLEGLSAARRSSQLFRNDQQLALVRRRYAERTGDPDFLNVFTFEANSDVSMSWYLRCDEMRALSRLLDPPREDELDWKRRPAEPVRPAGRQGAGRGLGLRALRLR